MKTVEEILQSGLIEQYVLGLSSPAEKEQLFKYIKMYPELAKYKEKMERTMENMAMSQSIEPPGKSKNAIIKRINELNPKTTPLKVSSSYWKYAAIIFGTLSIMLTSLAFLHYSKIISAQEERIELENRYNQLLADCSETSSQLNTQSGIMAFIKDENTQNIVLKGTKLAPQANALVHWNTVDHKAAISAFNLPKAPTGMVYQAWADIDGVMIDMGVITSIDELIIIPYMARAASINITLEKMGGSDHPDVSNLYVNGIIG